MGVKLSQKMLRGTVQKEHHIYTVTTGTVI